MDRFSGGSLRIIKISQEGNRIEVHVPALGCAGEVVVYNAVPKGKVTVNGKKAAERIDKEKRTVGVEIEKGMEQKVVIEK